MKVLKTFLSLLLYYIIGIWNYSQFLLIGLVCHFPFWKLIQATPIDLFEPCRGRFSGLAPHKRQNTDMWNRDCDHCHLVLMFE